MYKAATNFGPEWVIFWNDWERREFDWLTRLWERKRTRSLRKREKRALCLGKKEEEKVFVMFVSFLCVIWEGECMCNKHMPWFLFLFFFLFYIFISLAPFLLIPYKGLILSDCKNCAIKENHNLRVLQRTLKVNIKVYFFGHVHVKFLWPNSNKHCIPSRNFASPWETLRPFLRHTQLHAFNYMN